MSPRFPPGFVWGAATSAYQVEGAVAEDGRGESIWDHFTAVRGNVAGGDTGRVACDAYHRYHEDIRLMADLGLSGYRFSIAWPRIFPEGTGRPNGAGLDFYDRLVDELLVNGVEPYVTLYHWDLPQALEDAGGWPERSTVDAYAAYVETVARRLGDRVHHWITQCEPWVISRLGYGTGEHAPGRRDGAAALAAAHHVLLAHGRAAAVLRAVSPGARVGIAIDLVHYQPASDTLADRAATRAADAHRNRSILDPVLRGTYPGEVLDDWPAHPSCIRDGDLRTIAAPLDFLGVNYYTRHVVRPSAYPGSNSAEFTPRGLPTAANGWEVDPAGLTETLVRVARDYPPLPLHVTENGSAWVDEPGADGSYDDNDRLAYLASHLAACARAREQGADVAGYFAWSLLDNFEWAEGYAMRFGLVHVDFATQQRTVKSSGAWYGRFVRAARGETADDILTP
jgi:beta-glucosidase